MSLPIISLIKSQGFSLFVCGCTSAFKVWLSEKDGRLNELEQDTFINSYICMCVYIYIKLFTPTDMHMHI